MIDPCAGTEKQAPPLWESCRLRSLWDMLELNAGAFYRLTSALVLASDSIRLAEQAGKFNTQQPIPDELRQSMIGCLRELAEPLVTVHAKLAKISSDRLYDTLAASSPVQFKQLVDGVAEIRSRLHDELSLVTHLVLETSEQTLYAPDITIFGADFESRFKPDAVFEVDEAAKCLALGRPTASVFHLMRAMEIGIRALSRCLSIGDPLKPSDRNWGEMLKKIRTAIDAKWQTVTARSSGDGAFFDSLYASLDAVKNPWRNSTMHVENKYTDDEAKHIFGAVRGFMSKLASRINANGDPKA